MDENVKIALGECEDAMSKAVSFLEKELVKIRAGKANPMMLDGLKVEYYGAQTPLNQVATVTATDPRLLVVRPFEKNMVGPIEKAIIEANLGFNPQNDGEQVRVPVPALTEERRRDLVKQCTGEGETVKVTIRNARRDANSFIKALKDEGVSEDMIKDGEAAVQKLTDKYSAQIDEMIKKKEAEIMTI